MKNLRILFQGDSITDCGRDKRNYHNMGNGYPKYASEALKCQNPDVEFEFINFGISGNRTCQLFDRLYADAIAFDPDIISILIGINDVWHRYGQERIETTDEQIALNYRCILERIKKQTKAKIIMIAPYVLDCEGVAHLKGDVARIIPIIKSLAEEYADVYIPLNEYFDNAMKSQPRAMYYSGDGVHPNDEGAKFIASHYVKAVNALIK